MPNPEAATELNAREGAKRIDAVMLGDFAHTERPMMVVGRMSLRPRNVMMDQMYLRALDATALELMVQGRSEAP